MSKVDNIISGEVILNRTQETKNGKEYRQVVVQTSDKPTEHPSPVAVDFWGDKMDLASGLTEGSEVAIHVNIRGREWQDKYYASIIGWSVDIVRDTTVTPEILKDADDARTETGKDESSDDLPF